MIDNDIAGSFSFRSDHKLSCKQYDQKLICLGLFSEKWMLYLCRSLLYGSFGFVAGHEITHGFDDQGLKIVLFTNFQYLNHFSSAFS